MKNRDKNISAQEKSNLTKELAPILSQVNNRIVFDDYFKKQLKANEISEDEQKDYEDKIQNPKENGYRDLKIVINYLK